jgi:membrane protein
VIEHIPTSKGLSFVTLRYAARRTFHGFVRHRGLDSAATLTYFATLALFPGSLVIVSAFALASGGHTAAVGRITDILAEFLSDRSVNATRGTLDALLNIPNPGIGLGIGLALSVWAVSSYATAFGRATNQAYGVEEGRQFFRFRGTMMIVALVLILGFAIIATILLGTPTVAAAIGETMHILPIWIVVWNIAKWPVLVFVAFSILGILYYFSPNVKHLRVRWVTWGAAFALIVWGAATAGFGIYVVTFDTYNRVYGWLGGAVALLLWLYITNYVLVLGAEVDAEIVRVRQLTAGIVAESVIQLPLRATHRNLMLARHQVQDEAEGKLIRERADVERSQGEGI